MRLMYKKMMLCVLSPILVCLLISCNTTRNNDVSTSSVKENASSTTDTVQKSQSNITYNWYSDYDNGIASVRYTIQQSDGSYRHYEGFIDKNGKMLFSFPDSMSISSNNGYIFVNEENMLSIYDKSGLKHQYSKDKDNEILYFGDGYVITQKHMADFDSSYYVIDIYGYSGNIIKTFNKESPQNISYLGSGIFHLLTENLLYSANADKEIPLDNYTLHDVSFYDTTAIANIEYGSGEDSSDGYRAKMHFLDIYGNRKEILIPEAYGWSWKSFPLSNGIGLLLESSDNRLFSYNINTEKFTELPKEYAQKLDVELLYENLHNHSIFDNGYISLPLIGSDKKKYVAVFNTDWEIILSPTEYKYDNNISYEFSDKKLILTNPYSSVIMYNLDGTSKVFNNENICAFSDDVARISNQNTPTYIDKQEKILFNEIIQ